MSNSETDGSRGASRLGGLSLLWPLTTFGAILVTAYLAAQVDEALREEGKAGPLETVWSGQVVPAEVVELGRTTYVPAYSFITARGGERVLLQTTLGVHNIDSVNTMTVERVVYGSTDGPEVRTLVDTPVTLEPRQTVTFAIAEQDQSGGVGAYFIVEWSADGPLHHPIIETVMTGPEGMAFVSRGVAVGEAR